MKSAKVEEGRVTHWHCYVVICRVCSVVSCYKVYMHLYEVEVLWIASTMECYVECTVCSATQCNVVVCTVYVPLCR